MRTLRLLAVLVTLFLPGALSYAQSESCGDIVIPAGYYDEESEEERQPIVNCANPFDRTGTITDFRINATTVTNDDERIISDTGLVDYGFEGENFYRTWATIYRHSGSDYVLMDTDFNPPTDEEIKAAILEYFEGNAAQAAFYTQIYFSPDQYSYFFVDGNPFDPITDAQEDQYVYNVFENVEDYIRSNARSPRLPLLPGTYTVVQVTDDSPPSESRIEPKEKRWFSWLVPTAYAALITDTVTFTLVTETPPEPTGASNVFFLPGIMGSRLYEESDVCAESGDSLQKQRWISTSECDQLRMVTNVTGASVNNLYTYVGKFGLADAPLLPDIYASFVQTLEQLKESNTIQDFSVAPYDWRLNLNSILRSKLQDDGRVTTNMPVEFTESYLYRELERLASQSLSGKVTIVAHSNGGMVAKQLLLELERLDDPLLKKVDNLILVAVPQVGTPDAVWALLHGTELGYGLVMSNEVSRQLLNTMPFAHHLLPNDNYFSGSGVSVSTPVISFDEGELTSAWRNQYGDINNRTELHQFLDKNSGRVSPEVEDLLTPEIVDPVLLDYAEVIESLHGNWTPPSGLSVYQIAGTGLDTPSGITYFTDQECINRSIFALFRCAEYRSKLGYRVNTVIDGDATVVTPSAVALQEVASTSRWWLNLNTYNASVIGSSDHKNIFEVEDIRKFISDIVQNNATSNYGFIASNPPDFSNLVKDRLIFQLHSPLDLVVETEGGVISSSTITAEGSFYRRFGELQYISVPANAKQVIVKLRGLAQGSFTLDVETARNGEPQSRKTFSALPTSTSTQAVIALGEVANLSEATLAVDYDGNGVTDVVYTEEGEVVEASYETLKTAINNLPLKSIFKTPLLITASLAERYSLNANYKQVFERLEKTALTALKGQVTLLEKKKLISKSQREELMSIITILINRL